MGSSPRHKRLHHSSPAGVVGVGVRLGRHNVGLDDSVDRVFADVVRRRVASPRRVVVSESRVRMSEMSMVPRTWRPANAALSAALDGLHGPLG